jgi:tetratricopeptide (TPR) repeat protein
MANLEQELVDQWLRAGQNERVLRYVAARSRLFPRLYLYRAAIRAATVLGNERQLERFAEQARTQFPASPLGFVEGARILMKRAEPSKARRMLQAVEHQMEGDATLLATKAEIEGALSTLDGPARPKSAGSISHEVNGLDALRSAYRDAARKGRWNDAKRWAERALAAYPDVAFGAIGMAHAFKRLGKPDAARSLLDNLPDASPLERHLLLSELQRESGDDLAAVRTLTAAQRYHAADRRLLMRLADLYRDDGQHDRAHSFLRVATRLYPAYGTVRSLAFESDAGWLELGQKTLDEVLTQEPSSLLRYLHMVNRVAPLYPARVAELGAARAAARKELWRRPMNSSKALDAALDTALKNRWLTDVTELRESSEQRGIKPSSELARRVQSVETGLGPLKDLVELAWHNEHDDRMFAVTKQGTLPFQQDASEPERTVELFIPTPFFAYDDTEKPTYEIVRQTLRKIAETLLGREDLTIVPRLQLNWRHVSRRLPTCRAVSYHTRFVDDPRWLHVQEAPFAGCCSFDSQGFAGFSSIADDLSKIDAATLGLDASALDDTFRLLRTRYVERNVSKYEQPSENSPLPAKFVFVPLQVSTDIVADIAYLDGEALLSQVARYYEGSDTAVVVKRHPYCRSFRVQRLLMEMSERAQIVVCNNSVHDLLARCERVFTVNSGVGLEALLHEKPVIAAGKCDYAYAVQIARTSGELDELLRLAPAANTDAARRLLWFYWNRYLVQANDEAAISARVEAWLT